MMLNSTLTRPAAQVLTPALDMAPDLAQSAGAALYEGPLYGMQSVVHGLYTSPSGGSEASGRANVSTTCFLSGIAQGEGQVEVV